MLARGRPDAVADVARLHPGFVELVPQRDPAEQLIVSTALTLSRLLAPASVLRLKFV
jgi:hypothetical protein